MTYGEFAELVGMTMSSVRNIDNDELVFESECGRKFKFYHSQGCCECVTIQDICGNLQLLVGSPILQAEEISQVGPEVGESSTWTFYKFATAKGFVTVSWLGTSNGYYSESVSFRETTNG
jgi:hypothetical protein